MNRSRPPIWFIYGNCVYGEGPDDAWAAFAVRTSSYAWLSEAQKRTRMIDLLAAIEALEADVQILRVSRAVSDRQAALDVESGERGSALRAYRQAEDRLLAQAGAGQPVLFLLVSLRAPERDVASYLSGLAERAPRDWAAALRGALGSGRRRLLSAAELERTQVSIDRVHDLLASYLPVRPARCVELRVAGTTLLLPRPR